ncbi:MAG TPA: tetratricopeptide repeat protein [Polyangia bacterium]|nr:tetratricopeptide repeat protein [Polyangia bacterium]
MSGYSAQDVARMLGLPPARLRAYLKSGVLSPGRGDRGELRFSFQDLLLLRTAEGLVRERVPPARVRSALRKLRERLPDSSPLTGVTLDAEGARVVAREGGARWQVESGQVLLDFEARPDAAASPALVDVVAIPVRRPTTVAPPVPASGDVVPPTIDELYELGCDLEEADPPHAEASYRQVLTRAPRHADAHINLGRLLHERGDLEGAERHYREALAVRPRDATATFNLGVALEDQARVQEALEAYEAAIALNAENADAHYNAARLYEKGGDYGASLRHLRAYRDLTRRGR